MLRAWVKQDLLIVDDLFLARRITADAAEVLQAILHQRYKIRRAMLVTSNRVVQDWGKYLGDVTVASTILDSLMHRCVTLEFEGKSFRLKEAAARLAIQAEASQSDRAAWGNLNWTSGYERSFSALSRALHSVASPFSWDHFFEFVHIFELHCMNDFLHCLLLKR